MDRIRYISVPLNNEGLEEYNEGLEESKNIKIFELMEKDFNELYSKGIFDKINNGCRLLIDDYESEEIKGQNLKIALDISKKNKCEVLIQALELAIERNTLVALDF